MRLINIGFGNLVSLSKLISVVAPDSAPVKRIVQEAKADGRLIDATCGRKCKAVLITESNHIVLSAISCEAIQNRCEEKEEQHYE